MEVTLDKEQQKPKKNSIITIDEIDDYIKRKINKIDNYHDALAIFNKLNLMFLSKKFSPTPDFLIELIEQNDLFASALFFIFNKFRSQIISGNIDHYLDNVTLILSIEAYCLKNNIEIIQNNNIESDSVFQASDIEKMYIKEAKSKPLLSINEEHELATRISNGDKDARKIFIESNLRLVLSIAGRYINRGLQFLDLVQEGNTGLITAVDKFDVNKGYKFSTYATWWIKQAILRALSNHGRIIRLPVYLDERRKKFNKQKSDLEVELGRSPTIEEIASRMNLPISKVKELYELNQEALSLNNVIDEDGDSELEDFVPSSDKSPEDIAVTNVFRDDIKQLFTNCNLTKRETEVLVLRYGLNGNKPETLIEIGKLFGVSKERIRQIEAKAFKKIRNSNHIKQFAELMQFPEEALRNIEAFRKEYSRNIIENEDIEFKKKIITEKEDDDMKKLQSIYQYFSENYTKDQVDLMLAKLNDDEMALIHLRYGEDLENPTPGKLDKFSTNRFYGTLLPKMKLLLKKQTNSNIQKDKKRTSVTKNTTKKEHYSDDIITDDIINQGTSDNSQKNIEMGKQMLVSPFIDQSGSGDQGVLVSKPQENDSNEITKNDIENILNLIKTPTFRDMLTSLSVRESIVIALKFGYVDGKYFSTESISSFLDIDKDEINEITTRVLQQYKNSLNAMMDELIKLVTEKESQIRSLTLPQ